MMLQNREKQCLCLCKMNSKSKKQFRKLFIAILLIGAATVSNAQFEYGIKINGGFYCQSDLLEIANNCDVRFSPGFGLIGKYLFAEGFALKSGLEYQQKGRNIDEINTSENNKLQYLNLPVKAEFSAGEKAGFNKGQRVYFAAGPYLSYLLTANGELDDVSFDLKTDTKAFDFGLGLEIGFEFPVFTDKALQVGLNYDMGFIEVYKSEPDLHNKMVSFSLGLIL